MGHSLKFIVCIILVFIIGAILGSFFHLKQTATVSSGPTEVRENTTEYQFINPLLYTRTDKSLYLNQYKDLVTSLDQDIQSITFSKQASDVSVYFRDMNTGHWTGVNEDQKYHPSSMLKVVTMMSTLKLVENQTVSISDLLPYEPADTKLQYYPPNDDMSAGNYSVQDLLKSAIAFSDNGSNAALLANGDINKEFISLYDEFRLPAATSSVDDFMSARSYSSVWRSLYNASFLSADDSDEALRLLSLSTFKDGLVAGVPTGVTIAHKFGEYTNSLTNGLVIDKELHDCGIIYYPDHPYLLCVMTKGNDFPTLANAITSISKLVYTYVDNTTKDMK